MTRRWATAGAALLWLGAAWSQSAPESQMGMEHPKIDPPNTLLTVHFNNVSAVLTEKTRAALDRYVPVLNSSSGPVEIAGHTSGLSKIPAANQRLSEQRARAVREYLVGQGVEAERLTAVGYGQTQPIDTNTTVRGRRHNRRVEIKPAPSSG